MVRVIFKKGKLTHALTKSQYNVGEQHFLSHSKSLKNFDQVRIYCASSFHLQSVFFIFDSLRAS